MILLACQNQNPETDKSIFASPFHKNAYIYQTRVYY